MFLLGQKTIVKFTRFQEWKMKDSDNLLGGAVINVIDIINNGYIMHHVKDHTQLSYTDRVEDFLDTYELVKS